MIGRLTGKVIADEPDGIVVLDVNGVGYEVLAPLGTVGRAALDEQGRITVFVHTHVREDALALFGFASDGDRLAFRTLIGVSNVGPKTAVAVLSALPASELALAIASKNIATLTSIPGIGKKTAERLLLELRDKLAVTSPPAAAGRPTKERPTKLGANADVLLSALTRMGYKQSEAERAVAALGPRPDGEPLADALREALALLAK